MKQRRATHSADQLRSLRRVFLFAVAVCVVLAVVLFVRQSSHADAPATNALQFAPPGFSFGWFAPPQTEQAKTTLELRVRPVQDIFHNSPMHIVMDQIAKAKADGPSQELQDVNQEHSDSVPNLPPALDADHSVASVPEEMLLPDPDLPTAVVKADEEEIPQPPAQDTEEVSDLLVQDSAPNDPVVSKVKTKPQKPEAEEPVAVETEQFNVPHWYTVQREHDRLPSVPQMYEATEIQKLKHCMRSQPHGCIEPSVQFHHDRANVFLTTSIRDGDPGPSPLYDQLTHGLNNHPFVNVTDDVFTADIIIAVTTASTLDTWGVFEPHKLIVIDDSYGPGLVEPTEIFATLPGDPWFLAYFKRDFIHKSEGLFQCYSALQANGSSVFPITHALALPAGGKAITPLRDRSIDVLFAHARSSSPSDRPRHTVRQWLQRFTAANEKLTAVLQVSDDALAQTLMCRSKIVVFTHPAEGELFPQLLQALACGAVVFVDWIHTPHPHPFTHMQHLVFYDVADEKQFLKTIDKMLTSLDTAQQIADQGFMHVLSKYTTVSLADYVLRSAPPKQMPFGGAAFEYSWTGQSLIDGLDELQCLESPPPLRQLRAKLF